MVRAREVHESRCRPGSGRHRPKSADLLEREMSSGPGSIVVVADNNTALRPDVYVTSRGALFCHAC